MDSDGERVVQALEKLAVDGTRDEVLRCIRSVGAFLSSIQILEETSYRRVVLTSAEMIGATLEYAASKEGLSSAAREEISERVRKLRDRNRDQAEDLPELS
jgi:hypothetical protein